MAYLSNSRIFESTLPGEWRTALELLHELDLVAHNPEAGSTKSDQARIIEANLMLQARKLDEDLPPGLQSSSSSFKQWFSEAVLLWPQFALVGNPVHVDTIGLTTLEKYDIDLPPGSMPIDLRHALEKMFGWNEKELKAIEDKVTRFTRNLRIKRRIADILSSPFKGAKDDAVHQIAIHLLTDLYGPLPWRSGDVDVVISATAVFLCLPYDGLNLSCPDFGERPEPERDRIAAFLKRVQDDMASLKGVRFPSFGFFDPALVSPALLNRLVEGFHDEPGPSSPSGMGGIDSAEIMQALKSMVTLLPLGEIDKYLVHDVWGHGWQEALCEFEWTFARMPSIGEPLDAEVLAESFVITDGQSTVRTDLLSSCVEADLRRRIVVGLNLVAAELLADLIEYKYSKHLSPLPSSSILRDGPLRLDLSLNDVRQMIHLWRRPYRRMIHDAAERERLRGKLQDAGFPEEGLLNSIELSANLIQKIFGCAFDDRTDVATEDSPQVQSNLLQRVMLGLVSIDAALENFCNDGEKRYQELRLRNGAAPRWHCPAACIDLLALLLGWFYEQERELNIWHLDEFVRRELHPALVRLEEALG